MCEKSPQPFRLNKREIYCSISYVNWVILAHSLVKRMVDKSVYRENDVICNVRKRNHRELEKLWWVFQHTETVEFLEKRRCQLGHLEWHFQWTRRHQAAKSDHTNCHAHVRFHTDFPSNSQVNRPHLSMVYTLIGHRNDVIKSPKLCSETSRL